MKRRKNLKLERDLNLDTKIMQSIAQSPTIHNGLKVNNDNEMYRLSLKSKIQEERKLVEKCMLIKDRISKRESDT